MYSVCLWKYLSIICIYIYAVVLPYLGFPDGPPVNAGDVRDDGSIPGSKRCPGGGHGNPLQYSCLKNPMDRGPWWATVNRVAKSWSQLKWLSVHSLIHCGYVKKKKNQWMPKTMSSTKPYLYYVFFYAYIIMITFNSGTVREYPNCQKHYSCTVYPLLRTIRFT